MITNEQDPDVIRWGLQLFDSDPYSSYACRNPTTNISLDGGRYYGSLHFKDTICNAECCSDVNEFNTHALQVGMSELDVCEVSQSPHEQDENLHSPTFTQDWLDQTIGACHTGQEDGPQEADDIGPSSSCTGPPEDPYNGEVWPYPLELTDDYTFSNEVEQWLNELVPIPHIPRINGDIPSIDEATIDHQRLLDRLQVYDLVERKVQGDGNCQFRALSDQFYQTPEHHEFVRQQVVNQLRSHPEIYEGYVPMGYGDYLEKMSKNGEWGDHVTLQAAADLYGVKIIVITSFKDTCYIEILPSIQISNRVILLSFWAEVHYNSIFPQVPQGDVPAFVTKKKKKGRVPRNKHLETSDGYQ